MLGPRIVVKLAVSDVLVSPENKRNSAITVRYFAAARELVGCADEELPLARSPAPLAEVVAAIGARHPRLQPHLARLRVALNGDFAPPESMVQEGDELVLIPPVAGGSGLLCDLRDRALSVDEAIAAVTHPGAGGVAVFLGIVRDHADGKPVARLDYEAYPELAIKEMRRILEAIATERAGVRLAALHRIGELAVGDVAVVIAASAPHRAEAFAACREAIDRIKETVPIWKKEWSPEGDANWVNWGGG